jgi:tripartite ATP-independent transporter DctP family solute receptor
MLHLSRRQFTQAAAVGAAALGMGLRPAMAAARTLTVASLFGDDKPETQIWIKFAELLAQRLPGRYHINIAKNASLGGEKDVAEGIRLGSIQGSITTVGTLSNWVPAGQILDLPYVFRDSAHVSRVLDGPLGAELKEQYIAQGFRVLGFINYGARHLLSKEAITTPDQIRGKRIRVIQSPLHTELWKGYGANPTPIPIPEVYNALKSGVVEAMDLTKSAYAGFKLYEVVPYLTETAHIWAVGIVYVGESVWKTLSEEERVAFSSAGAEAARHFNQLIAEDEVRSVAQAVAKGAKIIQPGDRKAWEQSARPVWESFAPKVGGTAKIQAIVATA